MKNKLLIILSVFTISCKAQIYNINDKTISRFDVPVGSYFKDLDGQYDKYVGVWKGIWNGKTIYLELKKVKHFNNGIAPYYKDRILGERKIIASNGTVEIDRISNFDYESPEIWGMGIPTGVNGHNYPSLMFSPEDMCNISARLVVTNLTVTQMTLKMAAITAPLKPNCIHDAYAQQYGEYPFNFPKDIVLIKQ